MQFLLVRCLVLGKGGGGPRRARGIEGSDVCRSASRTASDKTIEAGN